jgi:uncharacterized protein (TIGR02118 family)
MVQMTVLYNKPADSKHFQEYYFATHAPIAKQMPGLLAYTVSDGAVTGPDGSAAPYELVAQLEFESADELAKALASPEGQAAVADLPKFATGGVSIVVFKTREI